MVLMPSWVGGCILLPLDEISEDRAVDIGGGGGDGGRSEDNTGGGGRGGGSEGKSGDASSEGKEPGETSGDETTWDTSTGSETSEDSTTRDEPDAGPDPEPKPDAGKEPACGDGVCSDEEDSKSCCEDCGCPGSESCEQGSCEAPCTETLYTLGNAWDVQYGYSELCEAEIPVLPYMRLTVSDENKTDSVWVAGGYSVALDVHYGASVQLEWQCCYVDTSDYACAEFGSVCEFDDGSQWYCECYSGVEQLDGSLCSPVTVAVCN